jgi:2-hydroxychromene-2-carboxylate isomerase
MARFAGEFGVEIAQPDLIPNTRRALAVTEYARERGKLEEFRDATMAAHWFGGKDIESDADLGALASMVGLDPQGAISAADDASYIARIYRIREEAHRRGVRGIPTFFIGYRRLFGCQPYEMLRELAVEAGLPLRTAG